MSLNRRAAKRDGNEAEIVDALVEIGATVQRISARGVADLLCGFRGRNYLLEVKAKKGMMTDDQVKFRDNWQGQYKAVWSIEDALREIGAIW